MLTTIIGATAGANLILLVLDSAGDRTARETATASQRPASGGSVKSEVPDWAVASHP